MDQIYSKQSDIQELLRKIFISIEIGRLFPDDKKAATDILIEQQEADELLANIAGILPKVIYIIGWGIYIIGSIVSTFIFIANWEYLERIVSVIENK